MRLPLLVAVLAASTACGDDGVNTVEIETTIDDAPPALTNQTATSFAFSSDPPGTEFLCLVDGGEVVQCRSPYAFTVADGAHTFSVSGTGANAKVDGTPAMHAWTVDATPPETTITAQPPAIDNAVAPMFEFSGTDAGGAVTLECSLDGAAFAACTSPHTVAVTDGAHTFDVRAIDLATNVDASPATHAWTVDTMLPDTTITSGPAEGSTTSATTAQIDFTSPTAGATFECALDGAAFTACTSPFSTGVLGHGPHAFAVRAKTAVAVDPSPAMVAWTIDTMAPDVAITATPPNPTNDSTPDFAFTSTDATATFQCRIESVSTFVACTSPWTVTPALANGAFTFRVRASDPSGNFADATHAGVVDLVAPIVTVTDVASPTNDSTPNVVFGVTGGPATTTCSVDGAAPVSCTSPFTSPTLADGAHTITVRATDVAGNAGMDATTFTVDTTPPVVTLTSVPPDPTNDATPTITWTVSEPATTTCAVDAGAPVACTSPRTLATLAQGAHTFTVVATDSAGNVGAPAATTFSVDSVAPTIAIGATTSPTTDTTPTIPFTITNGPVTGATCQWDTGATVACNPPSFTTGTALADGSHTITIRATDTAGNVGTPATRAIVVDTTDPVVTFTSVPTDPTNDATPTITWTVSEPATTTCAIDAGAPVACTSPRTLATLAQGVHTFTVVATDPAGNVSAPAATTFTVDSVAPTIAIGATTSPTTDATPTIPFTITNGPVTSATCQWDTGATVACNPPSFTTGTALTDGSHTITIRATDTAGNVGTPATRTIVVDTTAPAITFTDVPPSDWPVNYYDIAFTAPGATTLRCALNGAAFTTCSSPTATLATYNALNRLAVEACDAIGNCDTASTTWTPVPGEVLHYAYEQGSLESSSLLAQRPSYNVNGTGTQLAVGGWAGTALGSPTRHTYVSKRVLSSSDSGSYTMTMWVRPMTSTHSGILFDTTDAGLTTGVRMQISNTLVGVTVYTPNPVSTTARVVPNRWNSVALRTTGPGKPFEIWVDGVLANTMTPGIPNGFGDHMGPGMAVGALSNVDVDDLRLYNVALLPTEMCTIAARGVTPANCRALKPLVEFDLENTQVDTGTAQLDVQLPLTAAGANALTFVTGTQLGRAGTLATSPQTRWQATGFDALRGQAKELTLWFTPGGNSDVLFDNLRTCFVGTMSSFSCGVAIFYQQPTNQLTVAAYYGVAAPLTMSWTVPASARLHRITVTSVPTGLSAEPSFGVAQTVTTGTDVLPSGGDGIRLPNAVGTRVDELEIWGEDLDALSPEAACENRLDGEWDPATDTCALTSN